LKFSCLIMSFWMLSWFGSDRSMCDPRETYCLFLAQPNHLTNFYSIRIMNNGYSTVLQQLLH
jgi:hypothetical protein